MPTNSLTIGKKQFKTYEVLGWTGIVLSFVVTGWCLETTQLSLNFLILLYATGLLGAYIYNVVLHFISKHPTHTLYHYFLILVLAGLFIAWLNNKSLSQTLDLVLLGFSVIAGIGRIGCYHAGCCFGSSSKWGIQYDNSYVGEGMNQENINTILFPTQLIESFVHLLNVLIGIIALKLQTTPGNTALILATNYAVFRFFIEFRRGDHRPFFKGFSEAQWTASLILLTCVLLWAIL